MKRLSGVLRVPGCGEVEAEFAPIAEPDTNKFDLLIGEEAQTALRRFVHEGSQVEGRVGDDTRRLVVTTIVWREYVGVSDEVRYGAVISGTPAASEAPGTAAIDRPTRE